jgi:D-alanyl-D-alanine carboxypeptidase/D-alanyl-D-alanine-endopeptidase (penicillin-binding protein 4)
LAAVLVVLVAATVGLVTFRPAGLFHSGTVAAPSRSAVPAPPPSPVLAAAGSDAPVPSADAIAAALRVSLADSRLGSHVAVRVVDVATGQELFAQNDADPTTPASAMKLATATAVLALRGPAYQLTTRVVAGANPGEVVIIGGGDPTLAINATGSYPGAARLDDLADQVKRALGGTVPTKVIVDSTLYSGSNLGPNWDPSDVDNGGQAARITALMTDGGRINPTKVPPPSPRYPRPDLAAGQAFAKLLGVPTSAVVAGNAPAGPADPVAASPGDPGATGSASALPPGSQLGAVRSAPLLNIVEQMLANSDNTVAEMMARQVALARNQQASFAGGAAAVLDELNELGLPTAGTHLVDGSGLSPDDKLTTRLLTAILALVAKADHPQLHGVFTGLPVAGYSGTLAGRFRSPSANPADGEVRAKTGTLTGVHALVGYTPDAKGRLLAFAILVDKSTAPLFPAEDAVDRIASALTQVS